MLLAGEKRTAVVGPGSTHRYLLARMWDEHKPMLVWVGRYPGIADGYDDDQNVKRIRVFTKRERRYGGFVVVNLSSYRAASKEELRARRSTPEQLEEDLRWIKDVVKDHDVVVAWGSARCVFSPHTITAGAKRVLCLGLTPEGHPVHFMHCRPGTRLRLLAEDQI